MTINPLNDSGDSSSSSESSTESTTISTSLSSSTATIDSITNSSNLSSSQSRSASTSLQSSNRILSTSINNNNSNNTTIITTPTPSSSNTTTTTTITTPKNNITEPQPQLLSSSTPSSSSSLSQCNSKRNSSNSNSNNSSKRNSKNGGNILTEEDYIDFNINLTNKFKSELGCFNENDGGSSTTSGNNTPKSNRSSFGNNNNNNNNGNGNGSENGLSRNNSNNQLKSSLIDDNTPLTNSNSVMLRVKFPESHQIITKILRLPLSATIKECLYRIHQMVGLDNYKQCSISYNQSTLSPNIPLSAIFNGGDDSVVPTIEIKVNGSGSNKSSPRPILSHSSSVQSLLQGVSIKKKAITTGQSPKDSILFQPPHPSYTKDLEGLFWTTSPNHPHKSIPCLYHKWKSRDDKYDSKLTILYSGGNLEDIGLTRKNMKILSNILQVNILCFDFTGFGLNTSNGGSKPSLKECLEDLFIIFNYLTNTLRINSKNIILMGKSIGTIATLKFASELFPKLNKSNGGGGGSNSNTPNGTVNVKPSILSSPIESCKQYKSVGGVILLNSFGPGGLSDNIVNLLLSLDAFDHLKKVERITCPVLLIHSEEDQIVNVKSSKKLSKLFTNLYKFTRVKDAGHWNLDTHYLDDYEDDLIEFVKFVSPESFANRKERDEPPSYSMSPNKVVGSWLDRLELSQYTQNFLQFGYFDMASISTLDDISLLEMIGITDQNHISIFTREIEKITKSLYGSMVSTFSNFSTTSTSSSNTNLSGASSGINSSSTPSSTTPSCSTRNSANLDDFGSNSSSST